MDASAAATKPVEEAEETLPELGDARKVEEESADTTTEFAELPTHHRGRKLSVEEAEVVQERTQYLAIMGKRFPLDLTGGELTIHSTPVFISEQSNTGQGTGLTVWDGSIVLAKYMERAFTHELVGRTVVELGSGTGLVGIVASVLGAKRSIITDLPYTLDNARANVALNKLSLKGEVEVTPLDWTKPTPNFGQIDYIIASDVVWVQELIEPFVSTLEGLTTRPEDASAEWHPATVVMCHQARSTASDTMMMSALRRNFDVMEVPYDDHHKLFRDDRVSIFTITRKH